MKLLFNYIKAGENHENEDIYGVNNNVAWVIDGATEMFYDKYISKKSDTLWTVKQIDKELKSADSTLDLRSMLFEAIKRARKKAEKINPHITELEKYELPSFAICIIKIEKNTLHYLILGDCSLMFKKNEEIITDSRIKKFHQMVMNIKKEYSNSPLYKEKVYKTAQEVRKNMNNKDGYWIGTLDENVAFRAVIGSAQVGKGDRVLLCSDGFWPSIHENDVCEYEIKDFFDIRKIKRILREQNNKEQSYKIKTGNSISDDKTVLIIQN